MARPSPIAVLLLVLASAALAVAQTGGVKAKLVPEARFVLTGVDFKGMTATLSDSARLPLVELATVLKQHPETKLRIEAFLDPTDADAEALSQQRAEAVVARLVQLGAPAATLEAKGMGGAEFLMPSIVPAMKAKNRRVQVRVLSAPQAGSVATAATPRPVVATPVPTPVVAATPAPASGATRVVIVTTRNTAAGAGALISSALKRAGADVVRVAQVGESRPVTVVYHLPQFKAEAERLRAASALEGASLVSVQRIDPPTSLMVVLGGNERR